VGRILGLNGRDPAPQEPRADGVIASNDLGDGIVLDRYATRDHWLEARNAFVTGTDAAVLVGGSPYSSPLMAWCKKAGIIPRTPDEDAPQYLRLGNFLEASIMQFLAAESGTKILRTANTLARNDAHPELAHSPDGFVVGARGAPVRMVEIKNVGHFSADQWDDGPPSWVIAQCQHGMLVTGMPETYVGALIGGNSFRWFVVPADPGYGDESAAVIADFARRLRDGDAPDAGDSDADREAVIAMNPSHKADPVTLDLDALALTDEHDEISAKIKELKARKKAIGTRMIAALGGAPVGVLPDGRKWTYRTTTVEPRTRAGYTFTSIYAPRARGNK